jgi:hypothetical protein
MHFLFDSRIKSLYMFRALLAHPQEAIHKQHLVYCVRVMSVGGTANWHNWGFQEVEAPWFQDKRHITAVRLSALCNGRLYPPGNIPQGHTAAGRIMSLNNSTDTIGNRTRDLPACSAVTQPNAQPRTPDEGLWHLEILFFWHVTTMRNGGTTFRKLDLLPSSQKCTCCVAPLTAKFSHRPSFILNSDSMNTRFMVMETFTYLLTYLLHAAESFVRS